MISGRAHEHQGMQRAHAAAGTLGNVCGDDPENVEKG
jgi:hypothetical protein